MQKYLSVRGEREKDFCVLLFQKQHKEFILT